MKRNIIANMIGRAWGVVSVYIFVPLYLNLLGAEVYGLIGFYSTLLAVLAFADMGFTATLNRELARLSVYKDSTSEMRDLLRTFESAYFFLASLLALLVWALAPLIAEHWLVSEKLPPAEIAMAIRLMGVAIALQLPSGLYMGGLLGLQQQVRANFLQIAWGVFRGLGAVLVLWLVSPTIFAFALCQLICNGVYCFLARAYLWRALSIGQGGAHPRFKWQVFQETWRYAAGMAGMALVSALLTQTDKLVVSKMLSLESLGYYTLAGALSSIPLMLASPIATAVFPRLTALAAIGDRNGLARLYNRTCELVSIAVFPAGLTTAAFAGDFIFGWTGSAIAADRAGVVASTLLGGQIIQAILVCPYYLALAHGNIRLNLQVGIASVVLITPLLIFLITTHGVEGAGFSWLIMNICTLPPYMYFLHRKYLSGELRRWYVWCVARPLLCGLPCVLLGRWLVPHTDSRLLTFSLIALVWGVATAASVLTSSELRRTLWHHTSRRFGMATPTC